MSALSQLRDTGNSRDAWDDNSRMPLNVTPVSQTDVDRWRRIQAHTAALDLLTTLRQWTLQGRLRPEQFDQRDAMIAKMKSALPDIIPNGLYQGHPWMGDAAAELARLEPKLRALPLMEDRPTIRHMDAAWDGFTGAPQPRPVLSVNGGSTVRPVDSSGVPFVQGTGASPFDPTRR